MPIPALPNFKHRDTVVTPADQNLFVAQFENTMDTMSNDVIPAINLAITDINTKVTTATTARDEAVIAKNQAVTARDEAVAAVATLQAGAIDDTTIALNKAYSNSKTNTLLGLKLDKDFSSFTDKTTPIDTDNFAIQETGGLFKKLSWANLKTNILNFIGIKKSISNNEIINSSGGWIKNQCTAWAIFDLTTTPITIYESYNISSITRTSTGLAKLIFEEDMDNLGYTISGGASRDLNDTYIDLVCENGYIPRTLSSVDIKCGISGAYNATGSLINSKYVSVQIFGGKN